MQQLKSLITLELPAILELLSAEAVSETAKGMALELRPSDELHAVRSRLSETTAAKNMITQKSAPPFSGVKDIRPVVKRADLGGMLNTRELLDVAGLLRAAAASISYSQRETESAKTVVDELFSMLSSNKFLENKISSAIVSEEEISDNASRELADLRRHMRIASEKIRQTLNKIIASPTYSKSLQEPIITVRNGRYVVPVKAEYKSALPGLVHDISSSGATHFIEPLTVVQINNDLRELAAKEKQEIDRILMELSAEVSGFGEDIINDFEILASLDLIFAKAKLSDKQDAVEPEISDSMRVKLIQARHPLLPRKEAVPIDIRIGGDFDTLVITGPNTGGKTVSLKTLGLVCIMAQCGLHIPADEGSLVPVFGNILADIGDEQSIEQSLSTFSSHMMNIKGILDACDSDALLLFDELGAGTDPVEGAALAMAIIEFARAKRALVAATTHYAELKTFAMTVKGVANASCEFDVETLKPTYRLITGIPGKSNAFAISQRLGLPESVIEDAKSRVKTEDAAFEDALEYLERTRVALESDRQAIKKLLRETEEDRRRADIYINEIEREREKAADAARKEAALIIEKARATAESLMAQLSHMQERAASVGNNQNFNDEKAGIYRKLNEAEASIRDMDAEIIDEPPSRDLVPGDRIRLRGLGTTAEVISISPEGVLSLQAGIMKITARIDEVSLIEESESPVIKKLLKKSEAKLRELEAKPEIDLRGMQTDEAVHALERFLDNARLAKLNTVTVIHGKGTGALRQAVHKSLRREIKGIKSFRLGRYGEGEDGVTIVEL